jgi:hypothetical protein
LTGVLRTFRQVVADVDADVEGEEETGVVETEDRNLVARTVLGRADVVVVVGQAGAKGLHSLVRTLEELAAFGVEPGRFVPVLNHAPRSPRARAELAAALAELATGPLGVGVAGPVFLPTVRRLDGVLRDVGRLPHQLGRAVGRASAAVGDRCPAAAQVEPRPIAPGSLGGFASDRAAS